MHKSQKAATGVLSGDRTQDVLHSCAEPTTQLLFQLCSHSLGRFVDWLVRALHLDRYRVRPGCGRGQRPPRSPWWHEAMRPPALSNRLRRPGCVHPPQLGQRLRRKLCHVLAQVTPHRGEARWWRSGSARDRFAAQNFGIRALDAAGNHRVPTPNLLGRLEAQCNSSA